MTSRQRVPHRATERTVLILECLRASTRGLNISAISRKLQIPKSSVHPILLTLEELGFLAKVPEKGVYVLGERTVKLGQRSRHGQNDSHEDS